jgi:hypothetical protein
MERCPRSSSGGNGPCTIRARTTWKSTPRGLRPRPAPQPLPAVSTRDHRWPSPSWPGAGPEQPPQLRLQHGRWPTRAGARSWGPALEFGGPTHGHVREAAPERGVRRCLTSTGWCRWCPMSRASWGASGSSGCARAGGSPEKRARTRGWRSSGSTRPGRPTIGVRPRRTGRVGPCRRRRPRRHLWAQEGNCTCSAWASSEALSALRMYPEAMALSRLFVYCAM